jgi:hypothetical protein
LAMASRRPSLLSVAMSSPIVHTDTTTHEHEPVVRGFRGILTPLAFGVNGAGLLFDKVRPRPAD